MSHSIVPGVPVATKLASNTARLLGVAEAFGAASEVTQVPAAADAVLTLWMFVDAERAELRPRTVIVQYENASFGAVTL